MTLIVARVIATARDPLARIKFRFLGTENILITADASRENDA